MNTTKSTEPFAIIKNYRQKQTLNKKKNIKKRVKKIDNPELLTHKSKLNDVHSNTEIKVTKNQNFICSKSIDKFNQELPNIGLEEPHHVIPTYVCFDDDPFVNGANSMHETPELYKIDHQDSMMTQDQIREINSYFAF